MESKEIMVTNSDSTTTEVTASNVNATGNVNITAKDTLKTNSGADTNITGSKAAGDKVEMNVGKDLNIASVQNKDDYRENSHSSGASLGTGAISASVSKESTVDQAGIYADNKGFDITVADNTDLKGSVIDSNAAPDKNKLTTGTITNERRLSIWENQQLYAAFDYGKVAGPSSQYLLGKELAGAAIGLRGQIKRVS